MKNTLLLLLLWPITALGYYGLALSMSSLGAFIFLVHLLPLAIIFLVHSFFGSIYCHWLLFSWCRFFFGLSLPSAIMALLSPCLLLVPTFFWSIHCPWLSFSFSIIYCILLRFSWCNLFLFHSLHMAIIFLVPSFLFWLITTLGYYGLTLYMSCIGSIIFFAIHFPWLSFSWCHHFVCPFTALSDYSISSIFGTWLLFSWCQNFYCG